MSFHDEPMVVENGPLGVDIGHEHDSRPNVFDVDPLRPETWLRKQSALDHLLVIKKRNGADQTEVFEHFHLDVTQPVEFDLADPPGSGNVGTLILSFEEDTGSSSSGGRDVIRIDPQTTGLARSGRRLKLPAGGQLRMVAIRFFAKDELGASAPEEVVLRPAGGPVIFGTVIAMLH